MYKAFVNSGGGIGRMIVPDDYVAQDGEVLFEAQPTEAQLIMAFPEAAVAAAIRERCLKVDRLRETKFGDGMAYGGKVLQLGEIDQQRIIAAGAQAKFALLAGSAWPEDFGWIMADNTLLPLDAAGMSGMADAAAAQVQAWIFVGHAHKQALRGMTEVAEVLAYDIEIGW